MSVELLGILILVGLSSFGLTKMLCSSSPAVGLLDRPNERSLHTAPIPRTGGLAVFGTMLLGIIVSLAIPVEAVVQTKVMIWTLSMAFVLVAVSFWDDRAGLSPGLRLGVQVLASTGVVWGAGVQVSTITLPFLGTLPFGVWAPLVTIMFLVWMTNLYNFMDGMDGFAGGMTVLGFGVLGYLAWLGSSQELAFVAFLIAAAAGGFWWFNLPPARIFMGDVGSVPLGFLAGGLTVIGVHQGVYDLWVPILIFSPFIVDATVTLFRRLLRGAKIWHAHREHYYQRLVLAGWGHRKTVLAEYVLMVLCGLSAVLYGRADEIWRLAILIGGAALYAGLVQAVVWIERRGPYVHAGAGS